MHRLCRTVPPAGFTAGAMCVRPLRRTGGQRQLPAVRSARSLRPSGAALRHPDRVHLLELDRARADDRYESVDRRATRRASSGSGVPARSRAHHHRPLVAQCGSPRRRRKRSAPSRGIRGRPPAVRMQGAASRSRLRASASPRRRAAGSAHPGGPSRRRGVASDPASWRHRLGDAGELSSRPTVGLLLHRPTLTSPPCRGRPDHRRRANCSSKRVRVDRGAVRVRRRPAAGSS
jgi:hypothetical protein